MQALLGHALEPLVRFDVFSIVGEHIAAMEVPILLAPCTCRAVACRACALGLPCKGHSLGAEIFDMITPGTKSCFLVLHEAGDQMLASVGYIGPRRKGKGLSVSLGPISVWCR